MLLLIQMTGLNEKAAAGGDRDHPAFSLIKNGKTSENHLHVNSDNFVGH
jgi:hypothetical protein